MPSDWRRGVELLCAALLVEIMVPLIDSNSSGPCPRQTLPSSPAGCPGAAILSPSYVAGRAGSNAGLDFRRVHRVRSEGRLITSLNPLGPPPSCLAPESACHPDHGSGAPLRGGARDESPICWRGSGPMQPPGEAATRSSRRSGRIQLSLGAPDAQRSATSHLTLNSTYVALSHGSKATTLEADAPPPRFAVRATPAMAARI